MNKQVVLTTPSFHGNEAQLGMIKYLLIYKSDNVLTDSSIRIEPYNSQPLPDAPPRVILIIEPRDFMRITFRETDIVLISQHLLSEPTSSITLQELLEQGHQIFAMDDLTSFEIREVQVADKDRLVLIEHSLQARLIELLTEKDQEPMREKAEVLMN